MTMEFRTMSHRSSALSKSLNSALETFTFGDSSCINLIASSEDISFDFVFYVILFRILKTELSNESLVRYARSSTLGRLSSEIAKVLRGKNKPQFTPHIDTGDYVIVINAEKIAVTGKKLEQKMYYHHSDYVGGMKEVTLKEKLEKKPETVIELAVKGMLPKGPLGREMYTKLFVYVGPDHKHAAQKPEALTF